MAFALFLPPPHLTLYTRLAVGMAALFDEREACMFRGKLTTPEGKKFLLSVLVVFIIALAVLMRATIGGVIEEYNLPLSDWSVQMFILQGAMVVVYTTVITLIFSLPLAFYFLGEKDNH